MPAGAQTPAPGQSAAAEKDAQPPSDVTVFSKRRTNQNTPRQTSISLTEASSCAFGTTISDVVSGLPADDTTVGLRIMALMNDDEAAQSYFQDMGVENPNAEVDAVMGVNPLMPGARFSDNSPFGSAATGNNGAAGQVIADTPGGCTTKDALDAAGRSYIERHDSSMKLAFEAMNAKDYAKALALFKQGYKKVGYPQAALMIAKMYLGGVGTHRDTAEAIVWYKRAAEAPFDAQDVLTFNSADPYSKNVRVESQITLAVIYMVGQDVPKSPKEARNWYAAANKYGYVPAGFMLGKMAEAGYGGGADPAKAVSYYQAAGEYDFAPAQYRLGQLYYNGADGVAQDKTKAGAWLLKAAKNGYPDALYAVARMYELGEGGASVDLTKALVYYKEAAVKGQVDAQTTLATYLYSGEDGAPKDQVTARKLFLAAAQQGDPDAMFNLAVMMVNGEGGPKDLVRAYAWFYIADKGGAEKAAAAMTELARGMTADERAQADALLAPK
jgi:TPR repeat protein